MKQWQKKAVAALRKAIRDNDREWERVKKDPVENKRIGCEVMVRTTMTNGGIRRSIEILKGVK